jgi:hypothetical protein
MAGKARTFWTTDSIHGPAGRFRVVVSRLPGGAGGGRDEYNATLFRSTDDGEEAIETAFWRHSAPPHDADKLAFRERARKAAQGDAA